MNKLAFDRGFIKAAIENGVPPIQAVQLLKHANSIPSKLHDAAGLAEPGTLDALQLKALGATAGGAGMGAAGGALLGGGLGYLGGINKKDPQHDHSIRNAILMGGAGLGLGALGGGAFGAMHGGKELTDYVQTHPNMLAPKQQ